MPLRQLILALLIIVVAPLASHAAGAMSVQQAIIRTLEKNHLLKAASYEVSGAAADLQVNKRRLLPTIALEENAAISNSPTRVFMMKLDQGKFAASDFDPTHLNEPASYHDFRTALTLEQPLFNLSLLRSVLLSETTAEIGRLAAEQKKQEIAGKAYAAWMEVRRAKAYLKVAEKAYADAKEHLRLTVVKVAAGTGLKSDELRTRTFLLEAEKRVISAKIDVRVAQMQLGLLTGGPAGEEMDIDDRMPGFENTASNVEWHRQAMENRQDLKAIAKEQEKSALAVKLAQAAYYPTLNANASYQLNDYNVPFGHDKDSWQAGLTLRWELFSGLRTGAYVAKHQALQRAAEEYKTEYGNMVSYQVETALLRYDEAVKAYEIARLAVNDAEESVRLIGKRFENALSPLVDLLDAQTALNTARANQVEAENGQALAVATIWQAAGVFLKEALK